jgi:hypothetical protein
MNNTTQQANQLAFGSESETSYAKPPYIKHSASRDLTYTERKSDAPISSADFITITDKKSQTDGFSWFPNKFPINYLEHPFEIKIPILASVERVDTGFIASFEEANIVTSGDSINEALGNLASLIVDIYEDLNEERLGSLGPEIERQFLILQSYLKKM